MIVTDKHAKVSQRLDAVRAQGGRVAMVGTSGGTHEGHLRWYVGPGRSATSSRCSGTARSVSSGLMVPCRATPAISNGTRRYSSRPRLTWFLHRRLIPGFGMPIEEFFWLDDLSAACATDRRWSFLFASAPLNVPGGVGSPANALAIR